jgi:hypothetical protein
VKYPLLAGLLIPIGLAPGYAAQGVTEAAFREAVEHTEQLGNDLRSTLKIYERDLRAALFHLGYGPHHPIFRTSLNGFYQSDIDLDDLGEFKMGRFAFELRSRGTQLTPDPFVAWAEVQKQLDRFQATMESARRVVTRAHVLDAASDGNIPAEAFRKLTSRWRAVVNRASDAHEHAAAVHPVEFQGGVMVPAEQSIRMYSGGTAFAALCRKSTCAPPR